MATNYKPVYLPYGLIIQKEEKRWFYSGTVCQFTFEYRPTFMSTIDAHGPQYRAYAKVYNPLLSVTIDIEEDVIINGYAKAPELAALELEAKIIDLCIFGKALTIPRMGTEKVAEAATALYEIIKAYYLEKGTAY